MIQNLAKMKEKGSYGVDAPLVVRNLFAIGTLLLIIAVILFFLGQYSTLTSIIQTMIVTGVILLIEGFLMLRYARIGKFKHRDRMLALHDWNGDERVLDIGTGAGLLMIGAAKRLTTGKAIGIDIWNKEDLSNNTINQANQNIIAENVESKAEVFNENIIKTSFDDQSFDVILSNLCLHNIYKKEDRVNACREIYRLIADDGDVIISDFRHTGEYSKILTELGMRVEKKGYYFWDVFPPLTVIQARKGK